MEEVELLKLKRVLAPILSLYLPDCENCMFYKKLNGCKRGYYSYEERTLRCKHVDIRAKEIIKNYKMVDKNWIELKKVLDRCERHLKSEEEK